MFGALIAAVALVAGGIAFARTGGLGERVWKRVLAAHVDDALDAAEATPAQRTSAHAAVDRVMAAFADSHERHKGDVGRALDLFTADHIDAAQVKALRVAHEGEMKRVGDVMVQAISDVHGQFSPAQRKKLVAWVREHKPARGEHRGRMMRHFASAHIEEALDAVGASQAQRNAIEAARDHVFSVIEETHTSEQGDLERAIALVEADRLDPAQIDALRAAHQANAAKVVDAIVQAAYDVHDALTAPQRKALVDYVRNHVRAGRGG
jgi:Spy/CpxP family protein refolding chaperone